MDRPGTAAAGMDRLPVKFTRLVSSAGDWVKHQAARLGTVTHAANNHVTSFVVDGGATVTRTLRDSTADRPKYAATKKRKGPVDSVPAPVVAAPACFSVLPHSFNCFDTVDVEGGRASRVDGSGASLLRRPRAHQFLSEPDRQRGRHFARPKD